MEPQRSHGEQERQPQAGGRGGPLVHQPEGDDLHLEAVLSGHAAEDAFLQGSVHHRPQDAEVPGEDARVILDAVVLLPAVVGVEGADGAGQKDGGVRLDLHLFGGRPAQLQSCGDKEATSYRPPCQQGQEPKRAAALQTSPRTGFHQKIKPRSGL